MMENVKTVSIDTSKAQVSINDLRKKLKELRSEMLNLEKGTEEYNQKMSECANIMHTLKEQNEELRASAADFGQVIGNITKTTSGMIGAFQTLQGAMTLFGVENENAVEAIKKLQSLMAMTQGLAAVEQGVKAFRRLGLQIKNSSAIMKVFNSVMKATGISTKATTASTTALGGAMKAEAAATAGATVATNLFKKALIATGIGAIVVLIGTLIAHLEDLSKLFSGFGQNKKSFEDIKNELESINLTTSYLIDSSERYMKVLDEQNKKELNDLKSELEQLKLKNDASDEYYQKLQQYNQKEKEFAEDRVNRLKEEVNKVAEVNHLSTDRNKLMEELDDKQKMVMIRQRILINEANTLTKAQKKNLEEEIEIHNIEIGQYNDMLTLVGQLEEARTTYNDIVNKQDLERAQNIEKLNKAIETSRINQMRSRDKDIALENSRYEEQVSLFKTLGASQEQLNVIQREHNKNLEQINKKYDEIFKNIVIKAKKTIVHIQGDYEGTLNQLNKNTDEAVKKVERSIEGIGKSIQSVKIGKVFDDIDTTGLEDNLSNVNKSIKEEVDTYNRYMEDVDNETKKVGKTVDETFDSWYTTTKNGAINIKDAVKIQTDAFAGMPTKDMTNLTIYIEELKLKYAEMVNSLKETTPANKLEESILELKDAFSTELTNYLNDQSISISDSLENLSKKGKETANTLSKSIYDIYNELKNLNPNLIQDIDIESEYFDRLQESYRGSYGNILNIVREYGEQMREVQEQNIQTRLDAINTQLDNDKIVGDERIALLQEQTDLEKELLDIQVDNFLAAAERKNEIWMDGLNEFAAQAQNVAEIFSGINDLVLQKQQQFQEAYNEAIQAGNQEAADLYYSSAKQQFEQSKKLQITIATIQGLAGVANALASAMALPFPANVIVGALTSATVAATTAIQIAKIKREQFNLAKGSASSGGSISKPSTTTTTINLDNMSNLNSKDADSLRTQADFEKVLAEQRVYVTEPDIRDAQNRVNTAVKEATY